MEGWTTIRFLHAQGKSIKAIAAELGVARNTVRLALRRDDTPKYQRARQPNQQLVPFEDAIERMVVVEQFIGSRIYREVRARGYTGGKTALYAHLKQRREAVPDARVTERFETGPAEQGQFDWSSYTVVLGGETTRVIVFCLTLGFSRRKFYWPSLVETQVAIFEALEVCLRHFGGVPKTLLVDNPKSFVSNADPAHFQWNTRFLELCGHYRFEPRACHPNRPRTKGKVERPFFYLEQHLIKGGTWQDLDGFGEALRRFSAEELDQQVHGTTRERPDERFARERDLLTPLPTRPFVGTHELVRKVSWDCLVSFEGSRYSVPWPYAAKQVWLRPSQGTRLVVRNQRGEEIACHHVSDQKGVTRIDPAHYAGLRGNHPRTKAMLTEAFARRFPDHVWFAEGVFAQQRTNGPTHVRAVLALADLYTHDALLTAFAKAREYTTFSHRFVRGLLEVTDATRPAAVPTHVIQPPLLIVPSDLGVYQRILETGR